MSIPSKVMDPNTKDLIAGDQDLGFLEGQARKILDNTLRKFAQSQKIMGKSFLVIGIGWMLMGLLYLNHSYFPTPPIYFFGFGLTYFILGVISLLSFNNNFTYTLNKRMRNVRDWKKFLDSKEGAAKSAEPQGRLEVLMRMVASMDSWLYAEKSAELSKAIIPLSVIVPILLLVNYIPRSGLMNDIIFVISVAIDLGAIVSSIFVLLYIEDKYVEKQNYWRPRLATYKARLDNYWRML
jgi:hypothetical protein